MPLCPQVTITPVPVTTSGMTQTSIIPVVNATTEEIDELQEEISDIEIQVNGKNRIYRQPEPPTGTLEIPLVEGDIWFDTDDGNKIYYWTGTAWVSVRDLGIQAAQDAAAAAAAGAAAAEAAAAAAAAAATAAQTTADGKNRIYRQGTQPTTGPFAEGDLWFNTSNDNQIFRYTSGSWAVAVPLGNNALGNLSANKITSGSIDASVITVSNINAGNISTGVLNADRIAAASIAGTKIQAGTIESVNIATGAVQAVNIAAATITGDKIAAATITAAQIAAATITATQIASGTITASQIQSRSITANRMVLFTLTADEIAAKTITAAEIKASTITAAEIQAGSITVDRLSVGTLTGFVLQTSTGNRRVRIEASTNSIRFMEGGTYIAHMVPAAASGVVIHYGSTPNPNATTFPQLFVSSGSALLAQSSGRYLEVSSVGVVAAGNFYSISQTFIQDPTTSSETANARIAATDGRLRRTTASSLRYKDDVQDIKDVAELDPTKLLAIPVRSFKFKNDYLSSDDARYGKDIPGFIAEEVAQQYPIAADFDGENVETWNERYVIPGMLALIQDLYKRVGELEK
jgi:hypothetical protein